VSLYVGLGRLVGTGGEGVWLSRFIVPGVGVTFVGLACGVVAVFIGGGVVVDLDKVVNSAISPIGNLLMVEALYGVGEN
jgi:hypothetical protein